MITREEARVYFTNKPLNYADITPGAIAMLELMINAEFAMENAKSGGSGWYWDRVNSNGNGNRRVIYTMDENKIIKSLYYRASGSYFESREVISFNPDGFIGFCGEADCHNCQPVINAFVKWCDWWRLELNQEALEYGDQSGLMPAT